MKLKADEIASAVNGEIISGDPETLVYGISTDSGKVAKGDLFVPLKGARTDGHKYIKDAINNGATAAFTSLDTAEPVLRALHKTPLIRVVDTLGALQDLGAYYRNNYISIPIIGVTGSVGKTTTRQMIFCVLSSELKAYATGGNANSQSGVPKTILEIDPDASIAVIEMGISEFGEMSRLSRIVRPDMAIITSIGDSHIGQLKSRKNIMLEKLHILDFMPDGGKLYLNGNDGLLNKVDMDFLRSCSLIKDKKIDIRFFGTDAESYYQALDVKETDEGLEYDFCIKDKKICPVALALHGEHMLLDSLCAMACALENGVNPEKAAKALKEFKALKGRGETFSINGINIINDAYNASPQSMKAALLTLDKYTMSHGGRLVAVLSDMLELGKDELKFHEEIGRFIADETVNIDMVFAFGPLAKAYIKGISQGKFVLESHYCATYDELVESIRNYVKPGDTMLIKGSNSMKLWKIPDELQIPAT